MEHSAKMSGVKGSEQLGTIDKALARPLPTHFLFYGVCLRVHHVTPCNKQYIDVFHSILQLKVFSK